MTATKNERLSALVDDEADSFEVRRLVDELGKHPEDLAQWGRYHLIGDAIRGGLSRSAPADFASRVSALIEQEPALTGVPHQASRGLLKPVAGVAMAASVAVAVLVGVMNVGGTPDNSLPAPVLADRSAPNQLAAQGIRPVAEAERSVAISSVPVSREAPRLSRLETPDARLNSFIVNHAEHAAGQGLMPVVRVVGYETPGE
ncbi:sigma-E factor negative regulatory protein [Thioalkalivibrio sulfidiphilus]|uniref:sigma-E factor negative regulatory protein n=1 Tax=Thioalkalivibrio sulfidiphilus TaxID=1033854 RepID=UPI00037E62AA|nr:sigma-E factor negative regulatory protein [Thioalkalivibrio sulfidiphilus]